MSVAAKALKVVTRIFLYISYLVISVLAVLTVVDVVRRFILGLTLNGVAEYSQMLLIFCMTAMAHALVEGRFIAVNVLVDRFPKVINLALEVLMGVISFAFFILVGWQLFRQIGFSIQFGEAYFMVKIPKWPMYAALGASFIACALGTPVYIYERLKNYKDPKEKTIYDDNPDLAILSLSDDGDFSEGGVGNDS